MISNDLWLLIAGSTLLASERAPGLTTHHDYDSAASFARLATFDWLGSWHRHAAGVHASNPFLDARIRRAIEAELYGHGYRRAAAPDMLITYYAAIDRAIDARATVEFSGLRCGPGDHAPTYDAGTLVIDIIDACTSRAIWRGWGRGAFDRHVEVSLAEPRLRQAIERILASFPPPG
jgi:hypothetical protein